MDLLLVALHVLLPDFMWGQGRHSYFRLENSLTLASWFASAQLAIVGVLCISLCRQEVRRSPSPASTWLPWATAAPMAFALSIAEFTRIHERLGAFGLPHPTPYDGLVLAGIGMMALIAGGTWLLHSLRSRHRGMAYGKGCVIAWSAAVCLGAGKEFAPAAWSALVISSANIAHLVACTLLIASVATCALFPLRETRPRPTAGAQIGILESHRDWRVPLAIGATTFTLISVQLVLHQALQNTGDHLSAASAISVALLGLSAGALIGATAATRAPLTFMVIACASLPPSLLAAFGAVVTHDPHSVGGAILLALPFAAGSTVLAIAFSHGKVHVIYCADLLGAAAAAFLAQPGLRLLREEGCFLALAALSCLVAALLADLHPSRTFRRGLSLPLAVGFAVMLLATSLQIQNDIFNVIRSDVREHYPEAEVLYSRSSLVGRYDVVRRTPGSSVLKSLENGRVIDTMRNRGPEAYRIDPRLPHTLIESPRILILGVSGDGVTKTARALGSEVYGVEINPDVVRLQRHELAPHNGKSYENIQIAVQDGRTYLDATDDRFDFITLLNAHFARGRSSGRAASAEYLQTTEAFSSYLDHLTSRGCVVIEEPAQRPASELYIWKILQTMRRTLEARGSEHPADHFFIFQWTTRTNNYVQILMKKTPFKLTELDALRRWLDDVDNLQTEESDQKRQLGPINARTTLLHAPDRVTGTSYARAVGSRSSLDSALIPDLGLITDDRPFPFHTSARQPGLRRAHAVTLLLALLIVLSALAPFRRKFRTVGGSALPLVFVVSATGLAYVIIEMVLIQSFEIFLGAPGTTFSVVLGSLLVSSGLAGLCTSRWTVRRLHTAVFVMMPVFLLSMRAPALLAARFSAAPLIMKACLTGLAVAPLGLALGLAFPHALRLGRERIDRPMVARLFAVNAAMSAIAAPLALNLSVATGLQTLLAIGLLAYMAAMIVLISICRRPLPLPASVLLLLVLAPLLAAPFAVSGTGGPGVIGDDRYEVLAVSYGRSSFPESRAIEGGSRKKQIPFRWYFWILRNGDRVILVDTGTVDGELIKKWHIKSYVEPQARLGQLGIAPGDVTDVVLTHAHWDHIGGLGSYSNARIWIQEKEYQHARAFLSAGVRSAAGMRWQDLEVLQAADQEGRLVRVDGTAHPYAGITLALAGDHTPGSQYVTVRTGLGSVVLAGDSSYLYRNNRWHRPAGSITDGQAGTEALRQMQRTAISPFYIVPGHDPLVLDWFPRVSSGIVRVAAPVWTTSP